MKFKIVSGGQTGVDRAGLEAAIALGLPYGGWVPKGRLAEDGVVPLKYAGMQEHTSSNYAVRTKANVRDSDATLIIAPSLPLSGGTMLTLRTAERLLRPHHVACLGAANAMDETMRWIQSFQPIDRPFVLNIAGPRESGAPGIQERATEFLCQLLSADLPRGGGCFGQAVYGIICCKGGLSMASKCRHCGSSSYGHSCIYSPNKIHEHRDDEKHCEWCGSTSYGHSCIYSPNKIHRHGPGANKCIWCGSTANGASCIYSPTHRHEK